MDIVCLLFDGITALDIVGPYEVLQRLPEADVKFVAASAGEVRTDNKFLALVADHALADVTSADVLVVPGGFATARSSTTPGCSSGSGRSTRPRRGRRRCAPVRCCSPRRGCSRARKATTHWASLERLKEYGAIPTGRRVVEQGKIVTAAGVSSGIDMGAHARGPHRRRRVRAGHPARHRVRPAAAVRRGLRRQGARSSIS